MRSLRARIFLTVWPLFVAAILAVGALSSRSARIELAQFEERAPSSEREPIVTPVASRVATDWTMLRSSAGARLLRQMAAQRNDSMEVLVLDTAGTFVAASDTTLAAATIVMRAGGIVELTRTRTRGPERQMQRLVLGGTPVVGRDSVPLGVVYLVPSGMAGLSGAQRMVAGIQRSLWLAVLLACALAAIGTWLLAYPLVAQVQRLTAAATRVQAKALSTRVRVSSRDELGALETSFNRMAASLEETEAAKRQLISDLAHELRTPLTNVIGLLHAMRDGLRAPDESTLRSTHEEALLLKQLIDELQQLALADAGGLSFEITALETRPEVERAIAAFQASAPAIVLEASAVPIRVQADARRLAQVLRNVLQNAVTHTPETGRITIRLQRVGSWAEIVIADTGRGIPAEQVPLIWERFYRVDPSRDRATGGMGLGLALSKRMVEGMAGEISATSEPGIGTTVTIRLPGSEMSA
jgi:signal transduction histidine kinase